MSIEDYLNGTLWVDEFVSHHQTLDNINKGFDDMHVNADRRGNPGRRLYPMCGEHGIPKVGRAVNRRQAEYCA